MVGAVTEVTGAPATYVLIFGEANPHFHALIAARGRDVPPERRMAAILRQRDDKLDPAAALELVPAVAAAYARQAQEQPDGLLADGTPQPVLGQGQGRAPAARVSPPA